MCTRILHTAGSSTILNLFPTVPFIYMYFAGLLLVLTSKVHVNTYMCNYCLDMACTRTCSYMYRHTAWTYNIPVTELDRAWPVEMKGDCSHRE